MKCPRCQHDNPSGAKFCEECAAPLARTCANCDTSLSATAKFCPECAHPVGAPVAPRLIAPETYTPKHLAEKILTSKNALEGERKQVTVLFADMKGSMELLAERDPEEARKLLDPVIEHMMEAVHRYEGTVSNLMGDGIMALFGAPISHEDHAVRACYAALRMQESVNRYADGVRRTEGVPIQIRVGLNSGEVVVGSIGNDLKMDYTAVGQTVHLAARMEQMATPGSILITAENLRLAEGYVEVKSLGPVNVKGLSEPVEAYEVAGAGPVRSRMEAAAARGLSRFVGRNAEIHGLQQASELAGAGHGQVVAVVGEPGVGKSRLFYEFTRSHRTQGWLLLESGSASYGKATPYLPVIDLIKSYFQVEARDDGRKIQEKLTGKLLALDRALEPTLPALLALLDVAVDDPQWRDLDPPQRRQRTLDAVKRLLLRESQAQPLLVVFEDLHWIDSETQALLDNLVESLPTARIFLLVNYRPEYQHGWGNKTYYSQIRIDPLPPESAGELLQALLGDDSNLRPLKQLLIQRTERNPFFLEEIVRTLVETKILTGMRGAYRLTKALEEIQVPATVQVVLAARIDRLPAEEKRLLQSAAVIGERVPFTLLQAVVEMPEEELRRGLGYLQASEFLYETSLFPELEYTFKHGLTHQVAYNSLLHERRRTLHAQLMSAIEILYANRTTEQIERLAHHAFGGELWAKAVVYLREAGSKAMTCSAYREAVSFLEKALVALKHHPEDHNTLEQAVDLRLALRTALFPSGNFGRILAYLREAEALAEALEDPRRLGRVCGFLSQHFYLTGVYDQAIAAAQRALTLTSASGEAVLPALANIHLGRGYEAQGNYHRAIDCFTQTMSAVEGAQRRERFGQVILPAVASRAFRAGCHAELGTFAEGHAVGEEALRIAELVDHPASLMLALWGVGLLALRQGDLARALPLLERAVHICQDAELPVWFPVVAPTLGAAYTLAGRVANAVPLLTRAMATERIAYQGLRVLSLAEAHLLARVLEEAHVLAERALALTREHEERGHQAYALRLLGEITAREDSLDIGKAEGNYRQALAIAEELGMRPLIAHCHVGLGKLYRRINKKEKAKVHLSDGIALMRQMEMGLWLQRAEAELKELA